VIGFCGIASFYQSSAAVYNPWSGSEEEDLARVRYSFPLRESQTAEAANHLRRLAEHEEWWVRLYVACIMTNESRLRDGELIMKLHNDDNEHVQAAMQHLAEQQSHGR
jgi:hypothetical protein